MSYSRFVSASKISLTAAAPSAFIWVLFCFFAQPVDAGRQGNTTIDSFNQAKRILIKEIYRGRQMTFYCKSQYTQGKHVIHNSGYVPKKKSRIAYRLEWEHVVPLRSFGHKFSEWRDGHPECVDDRGKPFKGRNCAEKMNIKFRYMMCDFYNLVPSIAEISAFRSDHRFGMIPEEEREFGDCDIEIKNQKIEPPQYVRGDIARIYFYMQWAYSALDIMNTEDEKLFKAWNAQDPVDAWECERARRVEEIQINENPFVKKACIEEGLWQ
jgi:deoxyribonuclease-1